MTFFFSFFEVAKLWVKFFFWSTGGEVLAHAEALQGRPSSGSWWQLSWSAQKPWIWLFRELSIFVDEQNEIL